MKKIILLIVFAVTLARVYASTYYWVGGVGSSGSPKSWNSGSNWSASSGGAAANVVPGSSDIAIFDASTNNCSPFVDISGLAISLTGLQIVPASDATINNVVSFVGNSTSFTISGDLSVNSVKPVATQYNGQISDYGNNTFTVQGNVYSNSEAPGITRLVTLPSSATYCTTSARVSLTGSTSSIIDNGANPASNLGFVNLDISPTTTTTFGTANALDVFGNLNIQNGGKLLMSKSLQLNSTPSSPFMPSTVSGSGVVAFTAGSIFIGGTLPGTYTSSNVQDMGTINFDPSVASTVGHLYIERPFALIRIGTCQNNTLTVNGGLGFNNGYLNDGGNAILLAGNVNVTANNATGTHTGTGGITMRGTGYSIADDSGITGGSLSLQNITLDGAVTMSMPTTINGTLKIKGALTNSSYLTMANGSTIDIAAQAGSLSAAPTLGTSNSDYINVTISSGSITSGKEIEGTGSGRYGLLNISGTANYTYNPASNATFYTGLTIASSAVTALTISSGKTMIFANGSTITHTGTGLISYTSGNGGFQYGLTADNGGTSTDRVNILVSNTSGTVSLRNPVAGDYTSGVVGAGLGSLTVNGNGGTCAIVNSAPTLWNGLSIGTGATLNLGSSNIYLNGGNWSNSGTFTAGTGNVQFNVTGQSIYNVSGTESFYTLTYNKSGGTLTLNSNVTVSNSLNFLQGIITTGSNTLTVGSAGSISGTSSSNYINGNLAMIYNATGSKIFPIGKGGNYCPVTINATALDVTPSTFTVNQIESAFSGTLPLSISSTLARNWTIDQVGSMVYSYDLTLTGTGFTPTGSAVITQNNSGTVSSHNTTGTFISSGLTSVGSFGLGEIVPVAPDAPTSVVATVGDTKASITFTSPVCNGGSAILDYTVTSNPGTLTATGAGSGIIVSGLTNGVSYTFTVTARNAYGISTASAASAAIVPTVSMTVTGSQNISQVLYTSNSDISVNSGATLTINQNATIHSITINAGAKLDLSSNTLTSTNVVLKASKTAEPLVSVTTPMVVSGSLTYKKTMDKSIWYFMSFPSIVTVASIGTQGGMTGVNTNWWIKRYRGDNRATNAGSTTNWENVGDATLTANEGYIIGIANSLDGDYELSFPLDKTLMTAVENTRNVTVGTYVSAISATHSGWNLVGVPYLRQFDGNGLGTNYITKYNGTSYDQYAYDDAAMDNLNPFQSFFIQAATTTLTFATGSRHLVRSAMENNVSDRLKIEFRSATGVDKTNLIIDESQSTAYQVNQDLEKWVTTGTSQPQIYTLLNGTKFAYNALPKQSVQNLPLCVYTQTTGQTTISADASQAPGITQLILTDYTTGKTTDLLVSDYSFVANAGITTSRFAISALSDITTSNLNPDKTKLKTPQIVTQNNRLKISSLDKKTFVRIYNTQGCLVVNKETSNNEIEFPLPIIGIYTVVVQSDDKYFTKKIVLNKL